MPTVTFIPSEAKVEVRRGVTLLKAAQRVGVDMTWVCGGNGICTTCRCTVEAGERNLSRMDYTEREVLETEHLNNGWRLGCQAKIFGDVTIVLPPDLSVPRE